MNKKSLWPLATDASQAIFQASRVAVDPVVEKHRLEPRGHLFALLNVYAWRPEPVSASLLSVSQPYSHPNVLNTFLEALAETDMLTPTGDSAYQLSEAGLGFIEDLFHVFYSFLDSLAPIDKKDLEGLEEILKKLVQASGQAASPANKTRFTLSQKSYPRQQYGPMARIDQHLDNLNAFRDDAHLAAWSPYDLAAETWEAFTLVWRGEANNATNIVEKLPFRGFDVETYARSLESLTRRGWLERRDDGFEITETGQAIRQEAEDTTDRLFFEPWEVLSSTEITRLHRSLIDLREGLSELNPEAQTV